MDEYAVWKQVRADIFWGDLAFGDHVLQIYDSERIFIDALEGFVSTGLTLGDCCIVIATETHLKALNRRLLSHGASIDSLIADHRYIPLAAEETLSKFMVNGQADEQLFMQTVSEVMDRAHKAKRMIRAFGEMVAILWAQGNYEATLKLESLWSKFLEKETFCLFCAYPKSSFNKRTKSSEFHVCAEHSKLISGSEQQMNEIYYKDKAMA